MEPRNFFYSIMGNPVTPLDPCNQPPCRPGAGRKKQRSFSYQAIDWFSIYIDNTDAQRINVCDAYWATLAGS